MLRQPGILACARKPGHERDGAAVILVRRVVQAAELAAVKEKPRVIVHEWIRAGETSAFLGHKFPEMQILLRASHLLRLASSSVREGEEIEQPVVQEPRERDDLLLWVLLLQQEGWAPVEAHERVD